MKLSFFLLADYHSIIKNQNSKLIQDSVKDIALAWLSCGLDPNKTYFYKQSDVPEILELTWILNCVTAKGLMNEAHAYKAATSINETDLDKGITMGLFSYPVLMSADILMFDSTHVPVGSDQIQHLEMTRDIAARFNHLYKSLFILPEPIINTQDKVVPGLDGRKMSKSYDNVIPLLGSEKKLKKSIMKIVTNSLEPGVPKDHTNCTVFELYQYFANANDIDEFKKAYEDGISWGEAKEKLFNIINSELLPIRAKYEELINDKDYLNDVLSEGAKKARILAIEKIKEVKEVIGFTKISLMHISASSWLKFGLFTVGLGQSFVFVLVPPLARDLGLTEIQTSSIFAISAMAWALTSAYWGRASDKYGRRNIAILGLIGLQFP